MNRPVRPFVRSIAIVLAAMLSACGDSTPAPPTQPTPSPAPAPVTLASIRATPGDVRFDGLGQTVQLSVLALFSDGTTRDVTAEATWEITKPEIASIEGSVLTGRALGSTSFGAHYQGKGSWGWLTVEVPAERLVPVSGVVRDQYGRPVASATVSSPVMVFGATTDANGAFALDRWYGPLPLRIVKYGYETVEPAYTAGGAPLRLDIGMPENPSPYVERTVEAELEPSAGGASPHRIHSVDVTPGGVLDVLAQSTSCDSRTHGVLTVRLRSGGATLADGFGCGVRVRAIVPQSPASIEVSSSSSGTRYRVTYRVPR